VGRKLLARLAATDRGGPTLVRLIVALLTLATGCTAPPAPSLPALPLVPTSWLPALPATHDALSAVLAGVAAAGPRNRWDGVRQEVFVGYLVALAHHGPVSTPELFPSDADVLAYLVNAHAAWTIALGEARKLRKLGVGALREVPFPLDGRMSTLATLAGEVARYAPREPRLALFLNPSLQGGPPLPVSALEGHSLDWQLASHAELCGRSPDFWNLDRERRVVSVSAFTDFMWGLPAEQPARMRQLLELVPPPGQLRQAVFDACGPSLQRCTTALIALDRGRFFASGQRR
jgi:hypothetical protein